MRAHINAAQGQQSRSPKLNRSSSSLAAAAGVQGEVRRRGPQCRYWLYDNGYAGAGAIPPTRQGAGSFAQTLTPSGSTRARMSADSLVTWESRPLRAASFSASREASALDSSESTFCSRAAGRGASVSRQSLSLALSPAPQPGPAPPPQSSTHRLGGGQLSTGHRDCAGPGGQVARTARGAWPCPPP